MGLIGKIRGFVHLQQAKLIVQGQSLLKQLQTIGIPERTVFKREYHGENILLLALYQKGVMRPDLMNLLKEAKSQGLYVVGVNTQKLKDTTKVEQYIDYYIEKPNFGRDFGSYKSGFSAIRSERLDQQCQRLIMLNDSVFYSTRNLDKFIENLLSNNKEVLGATENHEIEYHLGSFCIAFSGSIIRHPKFLKFWNSYRKTDVRQKVIKRGEMGLSKALRNCISSPGEMQAIYNLSWFTEELRVNPEILNCVSEDHHLTGLLGRVHPRPTIKKIAERVQRKYIFQNLGISQADTNIELDADEIPLHFATSTSELTQAFLEQISSKDVDIEHWITKETSNEFTESFIHGSQIHQNAIILYSLGMPIIKTDCVYRGVLSVSDVDNLASRLPDDESHLFKELVYSRQCGFTSHFGWKQTAWTKGLI